MKQNVPSDKTKSYGAEKEQIFLALQKQPDSNAGN